MSHDNLLKHIPTAQDALRSFLTTLLGKDAPLKVNEPSEADFDEANMQSRAYLVLTGGTTKENRIAVMLSPRWLPLLSKSMLGEPIEFGEPGADDLLRELASQAYGALRTQVAASGVTLPDAPFTLLDRGAELEEAKFTKFLTEISFNMKLDGENLGGFVLLPSPVAEAPRPKPGDMKPASQPPPQKKSVDVAPASFPDLGHELVGGDGANGSFAMLAEVELEVTVELGRREIPLADVLRLTTGSVIELDKLVGEPLQVFANGRLIAEGEAVVIDEQFGVRITNLVASRQRNKGAFL